MNAKKLLKKKLTIFTIVCAAVLCALSAGIIFTLVYQAMLCANLAHKITAPALQPIRFTVYGSGGDTISARFRLNNADAREIALIERSWNGTELFMEFVSLSIAGKTFYFPSKIYSDELQNFRERSGTWLPGYYMENAECLLYFYDGQSDFERAAFSRLAGYALSRARFSFFKVHRRRTVIPLSLCERGISYTVNISPSGVLTLFAD